jgi:hypothetical protein
LWQALFSFSPILEQTDNVLYVPIQLIPYFRNLADIRYCLYVGEKGLIHTEIRTFSALILKLQVELLEL